MVPISAQALSFNFSFTHDTSSGSVFGFPGELDPDVITGLITGLEEGTGAAASVEILTGPASFTPIPAIFAPIDFSSGTTSFNSFTVTGGEIVGSEFGYSNGFSSLLLNNDFNFLLTADGQQFFALSVTFTRVPTSGVSAVPLPAALPLFGTGLAFMGFIGWRRKRKLAAVA